MRSLLLPHCYNPELFSASAFSGLLVSAVVSLLIMFPVSAGSRPATGHADVVVDN